MKKTIPIPRILYLIFAVLMITIYVSGFMLYRKNRNVALELLDRDSEFNSIVLAGDISKILEKSEMILDLLEQNIQQKDAGDSIDVKAIIKDFRLKYFNVYGLHILNGDGENYNSQTGDSYLEEELAKLFNIHKENLIRSYLTVVSRNTSCFLISRASFDSENKVRYVFVCCVNLEELLSFDDIRTMYNFSDIAILDKDHKVLYSVEKKEYIGRIYQATGIIPFSDEEPVSTSPGKLLTTELQSNYSLYKIPGYPLFVALETEYKNILAPINRQFLIYLTVVSFLLILVFILIQHIISQHEKRVLLEEKVTQQSKLEAIGRVTSGVAHEFNNINFAIMSASELMKTSKDIDSKNRYLDIIMKSLDKATEIIHYLLSYSRKNFMIIKKDTDISDLIADSVKKIREHSNKRVDIQILNSEKIRLHTDPKLLSDVIYNLIENAVHAVDSNGTVKINYRTISGKNLTYSDDFSDPLSEYVEIMVADNGYGISRENLDKIFDPFFSTKEQGKGIGLGLSLAFGIVKEHSGFINVESETNKGSVFKIAIPLISEN